MMDPKELLQYGAIGIMCLYLMYRVHYERERNKELTNTIIKIEEKHNDRT